MTDNESIYHHHTPSFYLRAWATDNRIWWSGYGKIRWSELTVVGGENYFHRLQKLSDADKFHLEEMAKRFAYGSEANRRLIDAFIRPHLVRDRLSSLDPAREISGESVVDHLRKLDLIISNGVEDYHTHIENGFRPYLALMLKDDVTFFDDDQRAAEFLHGLMLQFTRTKGPREIIAEDPGPFENIRGVWIILHLMMAVTVGASFYLDRKKYKIVLIDNHTTLPFITGDQPIVNIHADLATRRPPEQMELYYPLSPIKSMLYLERSNPLYEDRHEVTLEEAYRFNQLIAQNSYRRLFAESEDSLKIMESAAA
jgi:hypothetical protein